MRIFALLLLTIVAGACHRNDGKDIIREFAWIEGTWKLLDTEMSVFEAWYPEGREWQGESYAAVNGMKVPTEKIRLYREGDRIVFSQRVKDRDGGEPVDYVLTGQDKNSWTFSHPDYYFPSEITYTRVSDVAMKVRIKGIREGQFTEIFLEYVRQSGPIRAK